ncbi:MAG: type II toxin-antitoxin system Phd/YefM family antitoxin [Cyanobacteria bacterium P01_G01_bin.49]
MDIHSASHARANLFKLLEQVNRESKPCVITSRKGDGVLISKDDWENIQETLYLQSIPGMQQSIIEGMATPLSECISEDELKW